MLKPYLLSSPKASKEGTHLRAIDRTLVLFLTLCLEAEFELEAGVEDNV